MNDTTREWTFFSNYAHVLVCIAENPRIRLRDVAKRVGITERTAARLVNQLDEANILHRMKEGRRNVYIIDTRKHLRHPLEAHCSVADLLSTILSEENIRELNHAREVLLKEKHQADD